MFDQVKRTDSGFPGARTIRAGVTANTIFRTSLRFALDTRCGAAHNQIIRSDQVIKTYDRTWEWRVMTTEAKAALRSVAATAPLAEILDIVAEDGGVIIENFLSAEQIARFNAEVE